MGMCSRYGTSAATLQGINPHNIQVLASVIAEIFYAKEIQTGLIDKAQLFISELVPLTHTEHGDI